MDKFPSIVQGEASESDGEDDKCEFVRKPCDASFPQGIVVPGEAPESDEEHKVSVPQEDTVPSNKPRVVVKELLHKKLVECNMSLHTNMMELLKTSAQDALAQLTLADQQLVKSQMRVQRANTSLRSLATSSGILSHKLSSISPTSYIPHITISLPQGT